MNQYPADETEFYEETILRVEINKYTGWYDIMTSEHGGFVSKCPFTPKPGMIVRNYGKKGFGEWNNGLYINGVRIWDRRYGEGPPSFEFWGAMVNGRSIWHLTRMK
jgi:hypothetical protein